jgi:hypothetical protein
MDGLKENSPKDTYQSGYVHQKNTVGPKRLDNQKDTIW